MQKKILPYLLLFFTFHPSLAVDRDTTFHNQFREDIGGWIAADATYSVYLPDGRTLWLFGDTFIGEVNEDNSIVPGSFFIKNSGVIQDGDELITLYGGSAEAPSAYMPTKNPDSTWYWPEHGLVEDDTLRIFAAKFRSDPGGPPGFQFAHAGNDIVNFSYPGLEYINSVEISASAVNDVLYGDRILEDASYVYIYGRRNDDPGINIPYPHVARAPKGKLMDQNWEFFTANGWSDDPMDTRRMHSFPVSQQYSVSRYLDKYIMLTQDIWLSPKIFTFTSDAPSGPWINQRLIYETPETEGDTWTYNAYAHPQFDRNAELLVSYNVNGDFFSIFNNVEIYRPRFIRVPYMNIDFAFWPTGRDKVKSESAVNIILYPNPVIHELGIHIRVDQSQHARIEILDIGGVLRYTGSHHLMYGDNRFTINVEDLSPGMYFLKIQGTEEGGRVKFVKK